MEKSFNLFNVNMLQSERNRVAKVNPVTRVTLNQLTLCYRRPECLGPLVSLVISATLYNTSFFSHLNHFQIYNDAISFRFRQSQYSKKKKRKMGDQSHPMNFNKTACYKYWHGKNIFLSKIQE